MLSHRTPLGRSVAVIVLAVFSAQCASGMNNGQRIEEVIPADPFAQGPELIVVDLLGGERVTVSQAYLTGTHLRGMVRGDTTESVPWAASLDSVRSFEVPDHGSAGLALIQLAVFLGGVAAVAAAAHWALSCIMGCH